MHKVAVDVNVASFFKPGTEKKNSMDFMDREMSGTMDLRVRAGDIKDPSLLQGMDSLQTFIEKNEKFLFLLSRRCCETDAQNVWMTVSNMNPFQIKEEVNNLLPCTLCQGIQRIFLILLTMNILLHLLQLFHL